MDLDVDATEDGGVRALRVREVDIVEGDGAGDGGLEDAARLVGGGSVEVDDLVEITGGLNGLGDLLS